MKYLIIIALVLTGCKDNKPKFKEGDCLKIVYEGEFTRIVEVLHILKVGKESYLANGTFSNDDINPSGRITETERDIRELDRDGIKIQCSKRFIDNL
jgi:sulfite reductase alpha subunit-like flavoprotein